MGGAALWGEVELWLKYQVLTTPEDEASLFYNTAYFGPDYFLGKQAIFWEVKWNL